MLWRNVEPKPVNKTLGCVKSFMAFNTTALLTFFVVSDHFNLLHMGGETLLYSPKVFQTFCGASVFFFALN